MGETVDNFNLASGIHIFVGDTACNVIVLLQFTTKSIQLSRFEKSTANFSRPTGYTVRMAISQLINLPVSMPMCLCLSACISSVCLSVYRFVFLPICLPVCQPACMAVCMLVCPVYRSVFKPVCLPTRMPGCLHAWLSSLSVCLSV